IQRIVLPLIRALRVIHCAGNVLRDIGGIPGAAVVGVGSRGWAVGCISRDAIAYGEGEILALPGTGESLDEPNRTGGSAERRCIESDSVVYVAGYLLGVRYVECGRDRDIDFACGEGGADRDSRSVDAKVGDAENAGKTSPWRVVGHVQ